LRKERVKPIIIINCKTYPQATGIKAVQLAKLCEEMAQRFDLDIRIAVQVADLQAVANAVSIPVYAQHADAVGPGKTTGWITAHSIKLAGGAGALLNHAERPLSTQSIKATIAYLKKEHLHAIVCAESVKRLEELSMHADATLFAIEPPELIGGDVSVAIARPDIVGNAVQASPKPLLIGAGIKDHNDFSIALQMGAKGVLLSSGIVLAKDWRKAFLKLLTARGQ
jgi:triosephosphate isomerase (TIM)